jgi:glycine/D-amino acid oxidase-like deaminating enzyme/nitrite reductase/ring-hydroxylating ferredoxin subunit
MEAEENPEIQNITAGSHISSWTDTINKEELFYKELAENIKTDVVIVGGGIAGITIAYCLVKSGKKVVIIEDGCIGSGETGRTTAHIVTALDDRYFEIEKMFGEKKTQLAAQSHARAIDFIESVVRNENIDCDFMRVPGYLFLHPSDKQTSLEKEYEAATKAGLEVQAVNGVPGMINETSSSLKFENQGQFHILKYIKTLADIIEKSGGMIFTSTHAKEIDHFGVSTDKGFVVTADHIVVATNSPVNNKYTMHLKQFPYRTYVIAAKIKKGSVPNALWWDTGDHDANSSIPPYHFVRVQPLHEAYDLLISGGEDHPTGLPEGEHLTEQERYQRIEEWTRQRFPIEEVMYKWSGQIIEPMDSLAYIGRNPGAFDNIYIVTGDSGNGITHGTIAGMLITDLINGVKNEWEDLYDPKRVKAFTAGGTWFKQFVGGFIDYLKTNPSGEDEFPLHPGQAEVIKRDGKKFGVYMDETNFLHIVSTECTHMGCGVKWNSDEKSWDCPCHGSRFTYEGKVMNGPANEGLPYHKEPGPLHLHEDEAGEEE